MALTVGLAAAPTPVPPPAVATAPALVATDTAAVEEAEPQAPEQPHLPIQDVRCTTYDNLQTDEPPNFYPSNTSDSSADNVCKKSA